MLRKLFSIGTLTFFACIAFYVIFLIVCSFYLKTIKRIDSIEEVPFVLPVSTLSFPSEGTCYWSMPYWWADESVVWGRHSGISDVMKWHIDNNEMERSTSLLWEMLALEVHNHELSLECLQEKFSSAVSTPKLKDISKEVPFERDKYGKLAQVPQPVTYGLAFSGVCKKFFHYIFFKNRF